MVHVYAFHWNTLMLFWHYLTGTCSVVLVLYSCGSNLWQSNVSVDTYVAFKIHKHLYYIRYGSMKLKDWHCSFVWYQLKTNSTVISIAFQLNILSQKRSTYYYFFLFLFWSTNWIGCRDVQNQTSFPHTHAVNVRVKNFCHFHDNHIIYWVQK